MVILKIWLTRNCYLEVVCSFNIFDWATFLSMMSSLLAGLLAIAVIKNKYHRKICVQQEMRVESSNLIPTFEKMGSAQQVHRSL